MSPNIFFNVSCNTRSPCSFRKVLSSVTNVTPVLFDKSSRNAYPRCFEVADWLVRFNTNKYVVLDDDWGNYGNTPIKEKLIRCDYYDRGLTKELSLGAIKLLNP